MDFYFIKGEDWQGLYFNNDLLDEDHELTTYQVLKLISNKMLFNPNNTIYYIKFYEIDQEWLENNGLPDKYNDIPKNTMTFINVVSI